MTCLTTRFVLGLGFMAALACDAQAQVSQAESCETIRQKIQAQTGILPKPDITILEKINAHPECAFTAAEVYRGAFGDRPMVKNSHSSHHHRHHDEDDDD